MICESYIYISKQMIGNIIAALNFENLKRNTNKIIVFLVGKKPIITSRFWITWFITLISGDCELKLAFFGSTKISCEKLSLVERSL